MHGFGVTDEGAEDAALAKLTAGDLEFQLSVALTGRIGEDGFEASGVDGLLDEVVGAEFHGIDREFDGALRGEDDDGDFAIRIGELGEEFNTGHAWHFEICYDDMRIPSECFFKAFHAVAGSFGAIAPSGNKFRQAHERMDFIFYDQYFRLCAHLPLCYPIVVLWGLLAKGLIQERVKKLQGGAI